ncbi:hypothetical protein GWC77_23470 [Paraburkholderia sp. NMBU_R16]|uniref:hypothetical protein n=1 Tax=Paraburkholderia sp. NMBU_R16 TaxID=2698676 RepID=UPI00156430D9|nr:hypothetical protein [Paraburkholderia sp. NMBU_R16]NRO98873.1 hypothetical protein [Paraburkholderia sp. NMBU_R16]
MAIRSASELHNVGAQCVMEYNEIFSKARNIIYYSNKYENQAARTEWFDETLSGLGVRASRLHCKVEAAASDARDTVNASSEGDREFELKKGYIPI